MALVMNDTDLKKSQEFNFDIFHFTVMQIAELLRHSSGNSYRKLGNITNFPGDNHGFSRSRVRGQWSDPKT